MLEDRQIDLVIDQLIERVLEAAWKNLLTETHRQHLHLPVVVVLEPRHRRPLC